MRNILIFFVAAFIIMALPLTGKAQVKPKYNYASQQKLIPAELGVIFMGMDIKAFSQKIKINAAEAEDRFEELKLIIPFNKNNIEKVEVKFTGLGEEQKAKLVKTEKIVEKTEYGDLEREVKRISMPALMTAGKLYEIDIFFKEGADLKKYVVAKFGKPDEVYKKGDQYHFFDMQWTKITSDKLVWLIRYYEETRALMLAGRISGSEWGLDDIK
ncbi:MAG: hypothetical protein JNM14_00880 [Ferruginibacter sp.]|nr:hypothetical protein [Ferruginibacter sp.]